MNYYCYLCRLKLLQTMQKRVIIMSVALILTLGIRAGIDPQATYMNKDVEETVWKNFSGEAPLHVSFTAGATDLEPNNSIEWRITHRTSGTKVTRYEEDFEYDFVQSGINDVVLYLREDNDIIDSTKIEITVSESHLEMPNAFSPNDDGTNDIYGAKGISPDCPEANRYKSIVSFHAWIFNRWGQKLFEWTDITKGWDGKFNGSPVKDGVYFVLVKALGADGVEYNIRRDVNLIRKYNLETGSSTGGDE